MTSKHTPGPWAVHFEDRWPWGINIGPNVLQMTRIAYSTRHKSLADVRDAVGFDQDEKANVVRAVAEQEANARLIAMAPRMYEALREARETILALAQARGSEAEFAEDWVSDIDAILNELEQNQ